MWVSVSLWSYIHSYVTTKKINVKKLTTMGFRLLMELYSFLLKDVMLVKKILNEAFPSPYGVIFILTKYVCPSYNKDWNFLVSVSLWSYIHSYELNNLFEEFGMEFPSPYGVIFILTNLSESQDMLYYLIVSVSLWSYIHSYMEIKKWNGMGVSSCFRLLMELYSFLPYLDKIPFKSNWYEVSVSLWSYIHSYL